MTRKPKRAPVAEPAPAPAVRLKTRMTQLLGKRSTAPPTVHRDGRTAIPRPDPNKVPAGGQPRTYLPPSRRGKRQMQIHVEAEMLQQIKQLALDHGTTQSALVVEAMNDLFQKYGRPPVA